MKQFDFSTTLGEIVQEMADEEQVFSLQQVRYGEEEEYSVLLAKGPGPGSLLRQFLDAVAEATGAEKQRSEFRVQSN